MLGIAFFAVLDVPALANEPPEEGNSDGYWLTEYEGSELQQQDLASTATGEYMQMTNSIALNGCHYGTGADNPHKSGSEASVHGWWIKKNNLCPSRADVTVWLQAAWCDAWGCTWVTLNSGKARIRPGGGSGKRVTVRDACYSNEWTFYRNVVDVDIPGTIDPPDKAYKVNQIQCRPPGPGYSY